ncbi:MAG: glycosyltransferase family 9 protein [Magnetococcales bacterium]|nr:glycosyltransferase family 9 protein [Magnetococcales bacterium]
MLAILRDKTGRSRPPFAEGSIGMSYFDRMKKPIDWIKQPVLDLERFLLRGVYLLIRRFRGQKPLPDPTRRILLIRRNRLGDAVCVLPLIEVLKKSDPQLEVHLLANPYNAVIFQNAPGIDQLHILDDKIYLGRIGLPFHPLLRTLRAIHFDQVVVIGGYSSLAALIAWFSGGRYRIGTSSPKGQIYDLIFDAANPPVDHPNQHQVTSSAQVLKLGGFTLPDPLPWATMTRPHPPTPGVLALCPDVPRKANRYPLEKYRLLLERLRQKNGITEIRLFLTSPDHPLRALEKEKGVIYQATDSVSAFIQEVSRCESAVAAEGGSAHITAALGLPTVVISGRTARVSAQWRPWAAAAVILERHEAIGEITADDISAALGRVMTDNGKPRGTSL